MVEHQTTSGEVLCCSLEKLVSGVGWPGGRASDFQWRSSVLLEVG